jgi:hypothetical protein
MQIEISNVDRSIAKNTLAYKCDLTIPDWGNITIHGVKVFIKKDELWLKLPDRGIKNPDGTWGEAQPIISLPSQAFEVLSASFRAAASTPNPETDSQDSDNLPF